MFLFTTSAVASATTHISGTWITTNQSVLNIAVQKLNPSLAQVRGSKMFSQAKMRL